MNYVFWFTKQSDVYWHGIVIAIAIAAAILMTAGLRRVQKKNDLPVYIGAAIALPLGYLLSRISYWFFNKEYFDGIFDAIFSPSVGGNTIFGAAFGILISLLVVRSVFHIDDFFALLDAFAPAAMLGICIGRLSGYFSIDDRGKIIEIPSLQRFPYAIYDAYDGSWHLSVFVLEAIAAAVICLLSLILFCYIYTGKKKRITSGNVMLITLLLFGTTQGPLEGMRLDSMFMNSLGFVRVMQITSLVLIVFVHVFYSVTSIRKAGFRLIHIVIWLLTAGLLTLAFFMEFRIHSAVFARNYAIMITCLSLIACFTGHMFAITYSPSHKSTGLMIPIGKRR